MTFALSSTQEDAPSCPPTPLTQTHNPLCSPALHTRPSPYLHPQPDAWPCHSSNQQECDIVLPLHSVPWIHQGKALNASVPIPFSSVSGCHFAPVLFPPISRLLLKCNDNVYLLCVNMLVALAFHLQPICLCLTYCTWLGIPLSASLSASLCVSVFLSLSLSVSFTHTHTHTHTHSAPHHCA